MTKLLFERIASIFFVAVIATGIPALAQTFTTIANFNQTTGGNAAYGPLVQGLNGNFYGTTPSWGVGAKCKISSGCGTIFEVSPAGVITVLYSFCSQTNCADGEAPQAGLTLGVDGNFYGTTSAGGSTGKGTIFKISPSGNFSTLHNFCSLSSCSDGWLPVGNLVQGVNGNFFGVTASGGNNTYCAPGCGTIYQITAGGTFSTFFKFCSIRSCPEGAGARAGLALDNTGAFYGTTANKGTTGEGTVYKITLSGQVSTIHTFFSESGGTDGWNPTTALTLAANGNLYGTTQSGGANGAGTIYQVSPSGQFSTFYSFCSDRSGNFCIDGATPISALVNATDGNLYGTTWAGGTIGDGNAFLITTSGVVTPLYSFCSQSSCTDGALPDAGLMQATNGSFYGPTVSGGAQSTGCQGNGCGTVYSISMGLGPFVETLPTFGRTGYKIKILGNGLKAATGVTFNGTPATFSAVSNSYIVAVVPAGATSGTVEVTMPSGTLSSNTQFKVVP